MPSLKSGATCVLTMVPVCLFPYLLAWTFVDSDKTFLISKNLSDFKNSKIQNVLQDILSNFDFLTPCPKAETDMPIPPPGFGLKHSVYFTSFSHYHLSISPSICLSTYPSLSLSIALSLHLSILQAVHLSIPPTLNLSITHLST